MSEMWTRTPLLGVKGCVGWDVDLVLEEVQPLLHVPLLGLQMGTYSARVRRMASILDTEECAPIEPFIMADME